MPGRVESKSITELARELRNNPTPAERRLWERLRRKQLKGYKFLRQKPIIYWHRDKQAYFFIADFYCAEQKLVIELDGAYHQTERQRSYDRNRDLVIRKLGIQILRIQNSELQNMEAVEEKIRSYLD